MPGNTRERMVQAAVQALQRRGVAGMSFTEVLTSSGAARGAIYHHFPGGKAQLVAEAASRNGADVRAQLVLLPATSPRTVVESFLAAVRPVVESATIGGGCAVAAVTVVDDEHGDQLRRTAASAFASWIDALADALTRAGLTAGDATDLAATLIALLEGAHILCRAAESLAPFDHAARATLALLACRYPDG